MHFEHDGVFRKAALWQNSEDPDDRARLRLMLDSLRPPPRSSSANRLGSSLSVPVATEQQNFHNVTPHGMGHREPMSIFNEGLDGEHAGSEPMTVAMDSDVECILCFLVIVFMQSLYFLNMAGNARCCTN